MKMPVSDALVTAILGYLVVFIGLALLMAVVMIMGKIMVSRRKTAAAPAVQTGSGAAAALSAAPEPVEAPGSAGEVKIHDVPDRDAAMIMAIVANQLHKPLNELRFKSIREIK